MNATAIKKYFESQYKGNASIFVAKFPSGMEWFLVGDKYMILLQTVMDPLLSSRAMFPKLPGEGQSFSYKRNEGCVEKGFNLVNLWSSAIDNNRIPADITEWCHGGLADEKVSRVFILQDGRHMFIQKKFLALLEGKEQGLTDYIYRAKNPLSPAIVCDGANSTPVALFLPVNKSGAGMQYLTPPQPEVGQA